MKNKELCASSSLQCRLMICCLISKIQELETPKAFRNGYRQKKGKSKINRFSKVKVEFSCYSFA